MEFQQPYMDLHSLYNITTYLYRKNIMDINTAISNYLGKKINYSEKDNNDGTKEVCDLATGQCYTVRERDGLIERAGNSTYVNRQVMVETDNGLKQLLNG